MRVSVTAPPATWNKFLCSTRKAGCSSQARVALTLKARGPEDDTAPEAPPERGRRISERTFLKELVADAADCPRLSHVWLLYATVLVFIMGPGTSWGGGGPSTTT